LKDYNSLTFARFWTTIFLYTLETCHASAQGRDGLELWYLLWKRRYAMRYKQESKYSLIMGLLLVTFLLLGSLRAEGWALTTDTHLLVEGDRLTGHLSQVTLRTVLEQLQKQFGLTYEVPTSELDHVISIDLQQTPIIPALAKILAPWDYAFTVNGAGRLQFLYITPKAPPTEVISEGVSSDVMPANVVPDMGFNPSQPNNADGGTGEADRSLYQENAGAPTQPRSSTSYPSFQEEFHGLKAPIASAPMAIQPVPEGTTMPMMPAGVGGGMQVTPATSTPNMPIIPATAYPPMDIQPVPGYLKEEMLRNIQP
jgi:hypothetical protein